MTLSEHDRDRRDLDLLSLNDLYADVPFSERLPEIAWITGEPIELVETRLIELLEATDE